MAITAVVRAVVVVDLAAAVMVVAVADLPVGAMGDLLEAVADVLTVAHPAAALDLTLEVLHHDFFPKQNPAWKG